MRIALLTYRGNMFCGGQGIYAAYLAREWKKAGHDVHVIAGPPFPELEPDIPLHEIPNENVFGVDHPEWARRDNPFALLKPLSLWELGVSRFGVFPEMQTFSLRLLARWKQLHDRYKFDIVFDNQCLGWGLLGIRATGVPVVSVIHHPLHIDREADFAIDPSLVKKIKRTLYFPLFMQQQVAPRLDKHRDGERSLSPRDREVLRHPREGRPGRLQRHGHRPLPPGRDPEGRRPPLRGPHRGSQERASARSSRRMARLCPST